MPETPRGAPYPSPGAAPNVPADIYALAEWADGRAGLIGDADDEVVVERGYLVDASERDGTLTYDGDGRLIGLVDEFDGDEVAAIAITYDGSGRVSTITEEAGGITSVTTLGYTSGRLATISGSVTP